MTVGLENTDKTGFATVATGFMTVATVATVFMTVATVASVFMTESTVAKDAWLQQFL